MAVIHFLGMVVILTVLIYKLILEPLFFHPLKKIPAAHWSIPVFGDAWILYQRYRARNNVVTHEAHLKHGSVVRMGRNELSVSCVDNGIKTVYGGGWEKHSWYPSQFASYGVINMFSTVHRLPHSQKKRIQANIYSKSFLTSSPVVSANSKAILFDRILPLLAKVSSTDEVVDVHDLNNSFTIDFMSAFLFGLANGTNFTQNPDVRRQMLHRYHARREYEFFGAEMPWVKPWSEWLKIPIIPKWMDEYNLWIESWCADMCRGAEKYLISSGTADTNLGSLGSTVCDGKTLFVGDEPTAYKQFKQGMLKLRSETAYDDKAMNGGEQVILPTQKHVTDTTMSEVYSEMLDTLGAGHETSAIGLTYLYWEMSKRPDLQRELRQELLSLDPPLQWSRLSSQSQDERQLPGPKQIDALPLLNAILMEALRLHAPIPGIEPRVSPHVTGGSTLGSYTGIPGGVRVSSMPYTLHRNTEVFPDPERFNPKRWLLESPSLSTKGSHIISSSQGLLQQADEFCSSSDKLKEMNRWFWAFGSGGRMCIGSNIATQTMKLLVSAVYTNFETVIVDDAGIEELNREDNTRCRCLQERLRMVLCS